VQTYKVRAAYRIQPTTYWKTHCRTAVQQKYSSE